MMAEQGELRQLYPATPFTDDGYIDRGLHQIYWREYGQQDGPAALFLHGGPGAGCFPNHARFFDPAYFRIILLDQRGCGRSTPRGELEGNDTPALVADIEELRRQRLGEEGTWRVILGGSWGCALALAYAQAHPCSLEPPHAVK